MKVYLDYAATTPVDKRVIKEMLPYFDKKFANPSSNHLFGEIAREALEKSREIIAKSINAQNNEIIFTSSATESNNMALKEIAFSNRNKGNHIITTEIEHDSVMETINFLKTQGFYITILKVDQHGLIDLEELKNAIKPNTLLVSIIHGNNEIGTIQEIDKIGKICKEKNVYFHTDAAQSYGKVKIDVQKDNITLLTASSHKIYGPKGVAFLYVRKGTNIQPLLHGGNHEFKLRSSTPNVSGIVGFAKAVEITEKEMKKESQNQTKIRDYLIKQITSRIKDVKLNGHPTKRLCNNINLSFKFIEGESIQALLNEKGIAVSTGSACSSPKLEPSHVLMACGLKAEEAHGSIRITIGRFTTKKEIDYLLKELPKIINDLRQISPFK